MNSDDNRDAEAGDMWVSEAALSARAGQEESDPFAELSRREIARRIALDALRADRHVLETSAATAFRDFSCAKPV